MWQVDDEVTLDDVFVALGSNMDNICTIFIVKLDEQNLLSRGITLDNQEGNVPVKGINNKHHNIVNLNYVNMGEVIHTIIIGLKEEEWEKRTKSNIKRTLKWANIIYSHLLDNEKNNKELDCCSSHFIWGTKDE